MELLVVKIEKPKETNFVLGQSHDIKTIEDISEVMAIVPAVKFGLAFCQASETRPILWTGNDGDMIELAKKNALAIGAGGCFILFLGADFYTINVLNELKMVPEVSNLYCATGNPVEVILADTGTGRAILGVVGGGKPKGIEDEDYIVWRNDLLRDLGY
jgi:adenosine/AMP kinase